VTRHGRRRGRVFVAAATAVVGIVTVASCGLPNDHSYSAIRADDIPFGIADTTTSTTTTIPPATTTTTTPQVTTTIATTPVKLYFVSNGKLQPVTRALPNPAGPEAALAALQQGPLENDQPAGLRSAVPAGTIGMVTVGGGVATVDLAPSFVQPTTAGNQATVATVDQPLAFGEIVLTLTSLPGIGQVKFAVGGQPQDALVADGSLVAGPVSADSYAALRAP
jgi:spore germination protein GerM